MENLENIVEDIEYITHEYQKNNNTTTVDSNMVNLLLDYSTEFLHRKYESTKEIWYLQKVIGITRKAIEITPPSDKYWLKRLHTLGSLVISKFRHTQTLADIEEAIYVLQELLDAVKPDHPDQTAYIRNLGFSFFFRFLQTRDAADLDQAINIIQGVIDTTPPHDSRRTQYLQFLQSFFDEKYKCIEETSGIEEAIHLGQSAADASPSNHPERTIHLILLARLFDKRHDITQKIEDIDKAVSLAQEANDAISDFNPVLIKAECGLYLSKRYNFTKAFEDIDAAVVLVREEVATLPANDPHRNEILSDLCAYLYLRYEHTGIQADLDEAIQISRDILNATSMGPETRLGVSLNLAHYLHSRYFLSLRRLDIEESICITLEGIESISIDHPLRHMLLLNLGTHVSHRAMHTQESEDLDESLLIHRYALEAIPPSNDKARVDQSHNLARILRERFAIIGIMSDIDESILLARDALESGSRACRSKLLGSLSDSLIARYDRTKEIEELNEAIALCREALEIPAHINHRFIQLHRISTALKKRFEHSEETADLTEAILMSREALDFGCRGGSRGPMQLAEFGHDLASLLYEKFCQTGAKEVLNDAINIGMDALNAMPQRHPSRAVHLCNLGLYLTQRFNQVKLIADGVAMLEAEDSADFVTRSLKGLELSDNFHRYGLQVPSDRDFAEFLHNKEYCLAQGLSDIQNAQQCFIEALYDETAVIGTRFLAGRNAMSTPKFLDRQDAYDIARYTVDLIPLLTSRLHRNSDKQSILFNAVGVSSLAAAVALNTLPPYRRPLAAIECLEIGRGLIAGALFEQYDISTLRKHHPELADSFLALQDRLANPTLHEFDPIINRTASNVKTEDSGHRRSEQELKELLGAIRSKTNFEHFRLPPSEHDMLQAAACGGPIVILNTHLYRCDALLIEKSGLRVLELPHLSQGILLSKLIGKHSSKLESLDTLAWLWDDIVCPVLDALGFTETPPDDSWPHVWWIPTGAMTDFPLHAAGHHLKRNGETALDRVISSYATSVKALIHSRRRETQIAEKPLSLVAVAMEATKGHMPLIHANREVDAIFNIFESGSVDCQRPRPYKDDVLSAMKTCQIFHFAGHGKTHLTDPLQSKLLLEDWEYKPLTVESMLETNLSLSQPFLAYLSACGTSQVLNDSSIDESIHLASAFQLAGFRHVIGTLWSVDDKLCVDIAVMTYASLCGKLQDDSVSRGLHDAVRELRDRWVEKADGYLENENDDDTEDSEIGNETETRAVDGLREARHAQLDDVEELMKPLWIPYVHFGV
ncbi:CHAT domain-containing protein [Trichoderma sp. SZMC 28012]